MIDSDEMTVTARIADNSMLQPKVTQNNNIVMRESLEPSDFTISQFKRKKGQASL